MGGWSGHGSTGSWVVMVLLLLVFWAGVVTVVVLALRHVGRRADPVPHLEADRILHARFARGEIDEQEFLDRRATLHSVV